MIHRGVILALRHVVTGVFAVVCMRVMAGMFILFGVTGSVIMACAVLRGVIMIGVVMARMIGNRGRGKGKKRNRRQAEAGGAGNGFEERHVESPNERVMSRMKRGPGGICAAGTGFSGL